MKVDIWSMGVLLFLMITYKFPFEGPNMIEEINRICNKGTQFNIESYIQTQKNIEIVSKLLEIDQQVRDLIIQLLDSDPEKRIDYADIFQHQVFNNMKKPFEKSQKIFENSKKIYVNFYEKLGQNNADIIDYQTFNDLSNHCQGDLENYKDQSNNNKTDRSEIQMNLQSNEKLVIDFNPNNSEIIHNQQIPFESQRNKLNFTKMIRINLSIHQNEVSSNKPQSQ